MDCVDWQTHFSTVKERTYYAFENSLFCDVKFTVNSSDGGQETLSANKYILAISSPVFAAMFYGDLADKSSTIHIEDCTREGLHQMLQFVHSDKANLTGSNVMEVLHVAEKYIMPFLIEKCKEYLQKNLKAVDVLSILPKILCYNDEDLKKHCWNIFDKETKRAVFSDPFLDVSLEMLCQILQRDTLNIKEVDLFKAVDHWASKRLEESGLEKNGKNKRTVLGEDAIRLIRFPIMKERNFVEYVLPCEILRKRELTQLFLNFHSVSQSTIMFNRKKRMEEFTSACRFGTVKPPDAVNEPGPLKTGNGINIKLNKTALLVGIKMFGKQRATFDVDLRILEDGKTDILSPLSEISSTFITDEQPTDNTYYEFTASLPKPLRLKKGAWYNILAIIEGPPSYMGRRGKSVVTVEDPDEDSFRVEYDNNDVWDEDTSVKHGQFPAFVFRLIDN